MEPGSRKCFLTNSEKPGGDMEQRRGEEGRREGLSWGQPSDPRPQCQQGKPGQPELPFCESCLRPAGLRDQGVVVGTTWWGDPGGDAGYVPLPLSLGFLRGETKLPHFCVLPHPTLRGVGEDERI